MRINVLDASNYFKGLLLLIRKDRKVTQVEIDLMRRFGKALGFEKEFCDNAIEEILDNKFIVDEPPTFSVQGLAPKFIKDGLMMAFSDGEAHPTEEEWLRSVVEKNSIDMNFFEAELQQAKHRRGFADHLEVDDLRIQHS